MEEWGELKSNTLVSRTRIFGHLYTLRIVEFEKHAIVFPVGYANRWVVNAVT